MHLLWQEPSIRKQGIIKHIPAISHLSLKGQLYFSSSNLDFCGSKKSLWFWEIRWKFIQTILLLLVPVREFFYNYFPKCGVWMWMRYMYSTFFKYKCDYCIASGKDSMVWEGENGMEPDGSGLNHRFITCLVTLREPATLSDISVSSLKSENSAYLNATYEN